MHSSLHNASCVALPLFHSTLTLMACCHTTTINKSASVSAALICRVPTTTALAPGTTCICDFWWNTASFKIRKELAVLMLSVLCDYR